MIYYRMLEKTDPVDIKSVNTNHEHINDMGDLCSLNEEHTSDIKKTLEG